MCGIAGVYRFSSEPIGKGLIERMTRTLHHRGPDDEGYYVSGPVALGHKRLSIIDLDSGKQPISNETETVWVVLNGEIYNYQELRADLQRMGHRFKTETDTEVIVHLYEEYGEDSISRLQGMFAFALWDSVSRVLLLARDRVGIKPIYYRRDQDSLLFASEIKAILADSSRPADVNVPMIDRFLSYLYVPGEQTLFRNILKLSPGHYLIVSNGRAQVRKYWDLRRCDQPDPGSSAEDLLDLLKNTVKSHLISDVPVGFLLSGGIDSTALLSLATEELGKTISTFTIGFEKENLADERPYARLAAKEFGTKHYDITITPHEFKDFLPKYIWHMEEPICEPPAVALYYVSKLAREHVKVLISGEGADEAFAGYPNYRNIVWAERLKRAFKPLNGSLSGSLGWFSTHLNSRRLEKYACFMSIPFEEYYYSRTAGPYSLFNRKKADIYTDDFQSLLLESDSLAPTRRLLNETRQLNLLDRMLYIDLKTWLPDDLLIKADKMTMANSVELRVPFLDHKVLEFAARLQPKKKLRGTTTKYLLRQAVKKRIPKPILRRKKAGFPIPFDHWLSHELSDFVHDLLCDQRTRQRGYFKQSAIEELLRKNRANKEYAAEVFSLLSLELWHRTFVDKHD